MGTSGLSVPEAPWPLAGSGKEGPWLAAVSPLESSPWGLAPAPGWPPSRRQERRADVQPWGEGASWGRGLPYWAPRTPTVRPADSSPNPWAEQG